MLAPVTYWDCAGISRSDCGRCCIARQEGARSRRWTSHRSDQGKSTPRTGNALLTAEGVNDIEGVAVEPAMQELVSLVKEYCGGDVSWSLVDRDHPWAVME